MRALDSRICFLRQALCLALFTPLIVLAQGPAQTPDAANPDGVAAPLVHPALAALPPDIKAPSPQAWQQAHDAVAAFPRGHADIVAWEQQAAPKASANSPAITPPDGHVTQHPEQDPQRHTPGKTAHRPSAPPMQPHRHSSGSKP